LRFPQPTAILLSVLAWHPVSNWPPVQEVPKEVIKNTLPEIQSRSPPWLVLSVEPLNNLPSEIALNGIHLTHVLPPESCIEKTQMSHRHKPNLLQTHLELPATQTGVTRCLAQPPSEEHLTSQTRLNWLYTSHPHLPQPNALHNRTCPCPLTSDRRTLTHFTPQHWLLCHMGKCQFESEFDVNR